MRRSLRVLGILAGVLLSCSATPALASADNPLSWNSYVDVDEGGDIFGVSCPSASLCVAVDLSGNVVTSTNPTGGTSAWAVAHVEATGITAVSCPSASLCVAVDRGGNVLTSTNPTGGAGAWTVTHVAGAPSLNAVSCPSVSLCVAGGGSSIVTSTNPTGGAGAWTVAGIPATGSILGMSCPSTGLCVASAGGNVVTSTNPTGGVGAWTVTNVAGHPAMFGVSCASVSLCVAVDTEGDVIVSTNPTGGESAWVVINVDPGGGLYFGISCPAVSLCVGVGLGSTLTSTNPAGGPAAWTFTNAGVDASAVSCPSTTLCIAAGLGVSVGTPAVLSAGSGQGGTGAGSSTTLAPPTVRILSGPAAETAEQKATFTFEGVGGGTYECSIDDGPWSACASGDTFGPLLPGDHLFQVRETLGGLTGPAASYRWTIDLPRACVLRVARARIYVAPKHKVRLVIHYTSYRPAKVRVSYELVGSKGVASLGDTSANFATAGVFRDPEILSSTAFGEVRAARLFRVQFKIAKTPRSCGRYYTKRLTIPKKFSGRTVWFQSDSTFAP
ncbi:MAG TPA: hypothetical protein VF085_05295 [Solirubrobacterales bacterium]